MGIRDERERIDVRPWYTYDISNEATLGFRLQYTDVSYEEKLAGLLNDYTNLRGNIDFSRQWSQRNTVLFGVTYRTYEAEGSDAVSGYGVSGGIERLLSEKSTLRIVAGLENTETADGESEVDPVGEITLLRQLETTRLLAQYRHVVSGGGSGNLSTRHIININFTRDLTERVSAGLGVRAYSSKTTQGQAITLDERDYVQLRATFVWNFTETFAFEGNYRYTVMDRELLGESANSNNITFWFNWRPNGFSSSQ